MCVVERPGRRIIFNVSVKDSPWDAVLVGSVASTVNAKIRIIFTRVT